MARRLDEESRTWIWGSKDGVSGGRAAGPDGSGATVSHQIRGHAGGTAARGERAEGTDELGLTLGGSGSKSQGARDGGLEERTGRVSAR
jgi:hypothetical protein